MRQPTSQCDPQLLESYLAGIASRAQMLAAEQHLDRCEACHLTIQMLAADREFWTFATASLDTSRDAMLPSPTISLAERLIAIDRQVMQSETAALVWDAGTQAYLEHWLADSDQADAMGRLDQYDVLEVIGCGGMGLVLKARDRKLRRLVAIKTLRQHLTSTPSARKRFAREAQMAAALRHHNIIDIYAVAAWREVPYLVMPFVEHGTLTEFRTAMSPPTSAATQWGSAPAVRLFELDEILKITHQIANGLAEAHALGMIHRDIKPSNILVDQGLERVLIADFGLARALDEEQLTHSGVVAGTPQFMSPEQALGNPLDTRSDLFSLGSLMVWLATGNSPFVADSSFGTLSKIISKPHTQLSQLRPELPVWLDAIVDRLLAKEPHRRNLSARQLADLLQECMRHRADPVRHPLPTELLDKRSQWGGWAAAAAASATFGLALWIAPGWFTRADRALFPRGVAASANDPSEPSAEPPPHAPAPHAAAAFSTPPSPPPTASNFPAAAVPESPTVLHTRTGPLDALDEVNLRAELPKDVAAIYWLERLAGLPVHQIPISILPVVEELANSSDEQQRQLATKILNKNPFEVIDSAESP